MENVWQVYKLQQIDLELDGKKEEINGLNSGQKLQEQIIQAEAKNNEFKQKAQDIRVKMKKTELEAQTLAEHIKTIEKQLYGGRNTNAKELMSWQQEAEQIKRQKEKLEDEIFAHMEEAESIEKKAQTGEALIEKTKKELEEIVKQYAVKLEEINNQINQIQQKRNTVAERIDEEDLQKYETIRKRKDGIAIAKLEGTVCGGCFMNLPQGLIDKIKSHRSIYCGNCGRILFGE